MQSVNQAFSIEKHKMSHEISSSGRLANRTQNIIYNQPRKFQQTKALAIPLSH